MAKYCPLAMFNEQNRNTPKCAENYCAWWCDWAKSCSIPLLTGMFADSSICQNVFENEMKGEEYETD